MKSFVTLITLLLGYIGVFGQNLNLPDKNVWPETPQAAALREVTMPPPSLSTGAVSFSIPLYTIDIGEIELPLELRYHSNGIRVNDDPYPVGYGWSLLPAFKVTRSIHGRPDGEGYEFIGERTATLLTHAERQRCMINKYSTLKSPRLDAERDIFTIHMPNLSFNAWLEGDSLVTVGHREYSLTVGDDMESVTVWDPYGNKWLFSTIGSKWMTESPMEWGLTQITLASGKEIKFKWENGIHSPSGGCNYKWDLYYPLWYNGCVPDDSTAGAHNVESGIPGESLHLMSILFPGGEVTFKYNGVTHGWTTIKTISVKTGSREIERIIFQHGDSPSEKTMLQNLVFSDGSKYSFSYDPVRFVGYDSQDYWGYYNRGAGLSTGPAMTIDGIGGMTKPLRIEGCDRSPNREFMMARMLTKVRYPTGGSVEWEYEPHEFDTVDFVDCLNISKTKDDKLSFGGGLRVTKETLRESDDDPSPQVVTYIYGIDGDGKAVLESPPTASSFLSKSEILMSLIVNTESGFSGPYMQYGILSCSPSSSSFSYRFGDPLIWYEEVQEIHSEGRVVHKFEKFSDNQYSLSPLNGYRPTLLNNVFTSGVQETETEIYGIRDLKEILLEKTETRFILSGYHVPLQNILVERLMCQTAQSDIAPDFPEETRLQLEGYFGYDDDDIYSATQYVVIPMMWSPGTVTHTEYTTNGTKVTDTEYSYVQDSQLPISVKHTRSGTSITTEYSYTDSFSPSVAKAMKEANVTGVITGITTTSGSAVTEELFEMGRIGQGSLFRPISYRKKRGTDAPYSVRSYIWNTDGTLKSHQGVDGVKTEYTWDAEGLYPLSVTVGGKLKTTATWESLLGVASLTDPAGIVESFTYDKGGRLNSIRRNGRLMNSWSYNISDDGKSHITAREWITASGSFSSRSDIDGLGRIKSVFKAHPQGCVASLNEYDPMGRLFRVWRDAPATVGSSSATIRSAAIGFHSDLKPYSETSFETSTRGRIDSETKGGEKWFSAGKSVDYEYTTNNVPKLSLLRLNASDQEVSVDNMYPSGSLDIVITTDEDGSERSLYTDIRGLKVCETVGSSSTRYVYDDYGDLRYILPPASTQSDKRSSQKMQNLCYWYDYDARGRLVTRKLPGAREERFLYDPADRLVAEKGISQADNEWRLYGYDSCGRQVVAFDARITDSQAALFAGVCRTATLSSGGRLAGYNITPSTGMSWIGSSTVIQSFYYDDYNFLDLLGLGDEYRYKDPFSTLGIGLRVDKSVATAAVKGSAVGKLTGKFLGEGIEVYYYDSMGMELQRCATGFDRGRTTTFYTYNLQSASVHHTYEGELPDLDTYFTYDESGRISSVRYIQRRLVSEVEKCDTAQIRYTYDEIGRRKTEIYGNVTKEVAYDLHDHLRSSQTKNASGSTLMSENVFFEDGVTPLYSGKVSGYEWRDGQSSTLQRYDYTYNRNGNLVKAAYSGGEAGSDYSVEYSYGLRGEITRLKRMGITDIHPSGKNTYGVLDDVVAEYLGNRPSAFSIESDANIYARRTGMRATGDYSLEYDNVGRMISDSRRGIVDIEYDSYGTPLWMRFASGEYCYTFHDSEGRLLEKAIEVKTGSNKRVETVYTYSAGGHVLRNDTLEMTLFPGGYFAPDGRVYYHIRDFRGNNVRVVESTGRLAQSIDYYPYGEPFREWNWEAAANRPDMSSNRHLFCGNERETALGLNQYDFKARTYVASFPVFTSMDPMCESYPWLNPYAYCGGDPINLSDPSGKVAETVWDILNVAWDIGGAVVCWWNDDQAGAKSYLKDLGYDTAAALLPFFPAGISKGVALAGKEATKAGTKAAGKVAAKQTAKQETKQVTKGKLKNADRMAEGKAHEVASLQKSKDAGLNVVSQKRLVPQNGKGNVNGNRTTVDQLIKNEDGTYTIIEVKLTNQTDLTPGQKAAYDFINPSGNPGRGGIFEVRSDIDEFRLSKGDKIFVKEYKIEPKYIIEK